MLFARGIGLWPGDALMVPLLGIAGGLAVVGARTGSSDLRRGPWGPIPASRLAALASGRHGKTRMVAGTLLIVFGLAALGGGWGGGAGRQGLMAGLRSGAFGAVLALGGAAVGLPERALVHAGIRA